MPGTDEFVLAEIAEMVGDDDSVILDLVGIYLRQLDELSAGIASANASGDVKALAFHAHSLKSSSGNLGATAFALQCHEFEREARAGALPSQSELAAFDEETQTVRAWFGRSADELALGAVGAPLPRSRLKRSCASKSCRTDNSVAAWRKSRLKGNERIEKAHEHCLGTGRCRDAYPARLEQHDQLVYGLERRKALRTRLFLESVSRWFARTDRNARECGEAWVVLHDLECARPGAVENEDGRPALDGLTSDRCNPCTGRGIERPLTRKQNKRERGRVVENFAYDGIVFERKTDKQARVGQAQVREASRACPGAIAAFLAVHEENEAGSCREGNDKVTQARA